MLSPFERFIGIPLVTLPPVANGGIEFKKYVSCSGASKDFVFIFGALTFPLIPIILPTVARPCVVVAAAAIYDAGGGRVARALVAPWYVFIVADAIAAALLIKVSSPIKVAIFESN